MTAEVKVEEKQVETEVVVASQEEAVKVVEKAVEDVKETVETDAVQEETKPESMEKIDFFKEETNFLSDLDESGRKALSDLKSKLEEAIVGNTLFKKKKESPVKEEANKEAEEETKPEEKVEEEKKTEEKAEEEKKAETEAVVTEEIPKEEAKAVTEDEKKIEDAVTEETLKEEVKAEVEEAKKKVEEEEEEENVDQDISLWGAPLLPSKGAEATDVILMKFLRAGDFKVNEAFEMLKKTLLWRKKHNIDSILQEDFGEELNSAAAYMN